MASRAFPILIVLGLCVLGGVAPAVASERRPPGSSAEALRIAREIVGRLTLGKLTVKQRSQEATRVRAELLANGAVVARIRVDVRTGGFLAEDARSSAGPSLDPTSLRAAMERALRQLAIGDWAWPTEHGRAWGVPLIYQGRTVGRLKVDMRKGVLPRERDDE